MGKTNEYSFEEKLAMSNFALDAVWLVSSYYAKVNLSLALGILSIILSAYMFLTALFKSGRVKVPNKLL